MFRDYENWIANAAIIFTQIAMKCTTLLSVIKLVTKTLEFIGFHQSFYLKIYLDYRVAFLNCFWILFICAYIKIICSDIIFYDLLFFLESDRNSECEKFLIGRFSKKNELSAWFIAFLHPYKPKLLFLLYWQYNTIKVFHKIVWSWGKQ